MEGWKINLQGPGTRGRRYVCSRFPRCFFLPSPSFFSVSLSLCPSLPLSHVHTHHTHRHIHACMSSKSLLLICKINVICCLLWWQMGFWKSLPVPSNTALPKSTRSLWLSQKVTCFSKPLPQSLKTQRLSLVTWNARGKTFILGTLSPLTACLMGSHHRQQHIWKFWSHLYLFQDLLIE